MSFAPSGAGARRRAFSSHRLGRAFGSGRFSGAPFLFVCRGVASSDDTRIQTPAVRFRRVFWAAGVAFLPSPAWATDHPNHAAHVALGAGAVAVIVLFVILPLLLRGRS